MTTHEYIPDDEWVEAIKSGRVGRQAGNSSLTFHWCHEKDKLYYYFPDDTKKKPRYIEMSIIGGNPKWLDEPIIKLSEVYQ